MLTDVFLFACLAAALAGLVRGFAGFGAAMILSPGLALLYGPVTAIAVMSVMGFPAACYLFWRTWPHMEWRSIAPIALAGVVAAPVGVWLLDSLDPVIIKRAIGVVVLACTVALAMKWRYAGPRPLALKLGVGVLGGFLGGSTGVNGPPVILFYLSGNHDARVARASLTGFFMISGLTVIAALVWRGLITWDVVWKAVLLEPVYLAGAWLGDRGFGRASEAMFRAVALTLTGAIGLLALIA